VPALIRVAEMREVLQHDLGDPDPLGCLDHRFARVVVEVTHPPRLFAGDLPQLLVGAVAAVGLKAAAQGKITVALVTQRLAELWDRRTWSMVRGLSRKRDCSQNVHRAVSLDVFASDAI
jgi:hypothetical protein